MSESQLRVIVLLSLVYHQFKRDIEQDEIRKAVLTGKMLNELNDFAPFFLVLCSNSHRGCPINVYLEVGAY